MIFKGHKFRQNKNLIVLPNYDEDMNTMPYVEDGHENYVYFGRVIKPGKKKGIDAVKTKYKWENTGETVYAIAVEIKGHSLTNMAYGNKDEIYLAKGLQCYQSKIHRI